MAGLKALETGPKVQADVSRTSGGRIKRLRMKLKRAQELRKSAPKGSGETSRASKSLEEPRRASKDRATHWRRCLRWPGKSVVAIAQLLGVDGEDPADLEIPRRLTLGDVWTKGR